MKKFTCFFFAFLLCLISLLHVQGNAETLSAQFSSISSIEAHVGVPFSLPIYLDDFANFHLDSVQLGFDVITANEDDQIIIHLDSITTSSSALSITERNSVIITDNSFFPDGYICTLNLVIEQFDSAGTSFGLELYATDGEVHSPFASCKVLVTPLKKGDTFFFGHYEQDGNPLNGMEAIEWRVLDTQENHVLVISQYVLDHVTYYPYMSAITWEGSYARRWLNHDFLQIAFTEEEKLHILNTNVEPHQNPYYNSDSSLKSMGNPTRDKLFLLSVVEAEKYFTDNWDRQAYSTTYAKQRNVSFDFQTMTSNWLLRQPHKFGTTVPCINFKGETNDGVNVNNVKTGVRPAMWLQFQPKTSE